MGEGGKADYVFGPVPSRRLGRSLGVDLVPFKVCTYDCIYCQLGRTREKTVERGDYVPVGEVLRQVGERLASGVAIDTVTMSGSGEPTLNVSIGEVIAGVKEMTEIRVAVLTNGSLFGVEEVRRGCSGADLVFPTLSAGSEEVFQRIHRPAPGLTLAGLVEGLAAFRKEFAGEMWLEVFVLAGINDNEEEMRAIKGLAEGIGPDRVQLNTAVRPASEAEAEAVSRGRLEALAEVFGSAGEVIADFSRASGDHVHVVGKEDVLGMLRRRPCTVEDIAGGMGMHRNEVLKYVGALVREGSVRREAREGREYYRAV